jgi:ribosomal protein L11 methyltransferase
MTQWIELQIPVNEEIEEAVVSHLFDLGSVGCQQFDNRLLAYFPAQISTDEISRKVETYLSQLLALGFKIPPGKFKIRCLAERDWNAVWKQHFRPISVSDRLIIKPTWETLKQTEDAVVIEIDPKQAFGTGSQATTRIALRFLEKYILKNNFVADVGTGTGILSIAAIKLGARKVVALDIDPLAVEAAKENFELNSTMHLASLYLGEQNALHPSYPCFDLIVANLNKKEIVRLLNDIKRLLKNRGYFIVSGILEEEQAEVYTATVQHRCFNIVESITEEGWIGFVVKRETL